MGERCFALGLFTQNKNFVAHKIRLHDTNWKASISVAWHKFGDTTQNSCFVWMPLLFILYRHPELGPEVSHPKRTEIKLD
jgi:hypothetical protein